MFDLSHCCHVADAIGANILIVQVAFGLVLLGIMIAISIVDFQKLILPDRLNVLLGGFGISHSIALGQPRLIDAALGALIASFSLLALTTIYRRYRGFDGLGLGDVKFVTAAGIWTGWQGLQLMLSVASTFALAVVIIRALWDCSFDRFAPLPFGPFLGLGTIVTWAAMVAS
jgi:prepilin signal peptidase PulO-like enzyme (type II secretory pathway)